METNNGIFNNIKTQSTIIRCWSIEWFEINKMKIYCGVE